MATISSSRIFIRGLPPNLSEEDFKKHFSAQQTVTDARLIPRRRIGYVGYKTPEEAAKAVKYFNRSYIRLSRLSVEIARPVNDEGQAKPVAGKISDQSIRHVVGASEKDSNTTHDHTKQTHKRKRDIQEEVAEDPRLREFLNVMGRPSKSKTWANQDVIKDAKAVSQVDSIHDKDVESDNQHGVSTQARPQRDLGQNTAKKASNSFSKDLAGQAKPGEGDTTKPVIASTEPIPADMPAADATGEPKSTVSDSEWLRSKTRRLLDLVDDDDDYEQPSSEPAAAGTAKSSGMSTPKVVTSNGQMKASPTEMVVREHSISEEPDRPTGLESRRLFVRNLPFTASENDIEQAFSPYGELTEVHVPTGLEDVGKGFAYVSYRDPESARQACRSLDGTIFQGRLMHLLPAAPKVDKKMDDFALSHLPLKKQRQIKKKAQAASSTFNWNSLYMSADAVMSSIADRLKISKSDLLDPTSSDAAINQAHAETHIIQETQQYFVANGVDLNAFQRRQRGDTAILVKNFPYGTTSAELKTLFEESGQVSRLLMPPAGTVAIVELANPQEARAAFAGLAYRRFKDSVLFLEKAPKGLFTGNAANAMPAESALAAVEPKTSASDVLPGEGEAQVIETSTLYIRNLNFSTTTAGLREICKPLDGFLSALVKTKPDPKRPGQTLSMGFGFLEFRSMAQAQSAARALNGYSLDGHQLMVRAARKELDAGEATRKADAAEKAARRKTKIIIKNLPFEATKKEVRSLFGSYGQLRSVRVPKKFDHSTRGFAFADFVSAREAENALNALKNTHLLGRRLVLEFAAEDPIDAEEEIQKMQQKVGNQVDKMTVQRLMGSGRTKFTVDGDNADE